MISVVVVIRVRLYREALARVLAEQQDLRLVGEAASAEQALREIERSEPDVVLLDIGFPQTLATLRSSRASRPNTRVVALGFGGTDEDALVAAEAGVNGYISIHQPLRDVPIAIRSVMRGEAPCDGRIAAVLLRRVTALARDDVSGLPLAALTRRERRILELVARGLSNKEIAAELMIGVATVKSHVHAILRKLDVSRRAAAADVLRRVEAGAPL